MAKNKDAPTSKDPAQPDLEAKVDAMMDASTANNNPIDIFEDSSSPIDTVATAPLLPSDKRKTVVEQELPSQDEPVPVDESQPKDDITIEPLAIDTPQTDAAIDDIVAQEADQVLAAQDAGVEVAQAEAEPPKEPSKKGHPVLWFLVFFMVLLIMLTVLVLTSPGLSLPFDL